GMARRLQTPACARAPDEEIALPNVASDPVVQRPVRPDPLSGRAAAPAAELTDSFEAHLEAAPAETARPSSAERPARADRPRASKRSDQARPVDDRSSSRTETRRSADSTEPTSAPAEKNPAKPADTAPAAKDPSSDTGLPVA